MVTVNSGSRVCYKNYIIPEDRTVDFHKCSILSNPIPHNG